MKAHENETRPLPSKMLPRRCNGDINACPKIRHILQMTALLPATGPAFRQSVQRLRFLPSFLPSYSIPLFGYFGISARPTEQRRPNGRANTWQSYPCERKSARPQLGQLGASAVGLLILDT